MTDGPLRRRLPPILAPFLFIVLGLAAGVTACTMPTEKEGPPPPPEMRVMTFNIRFGTAKDGPNAWPHRKGLVREAIEAFRPDVLGVQEAHAFQLEALAEWLPDHDRVGVGRIDGEAKGEHCAVLYDRRRLELVGHGDFWLSDTPDVPGSRHWGNGVTRMVTWARLRDRRDGRAFVVFNTHWDHASQPSRMRSADAVRRAVRERAAGDEPVILMGDFNAAEDNPAFRHLVEEPPGLLVDTYRQIHPDAEGVLTYHAWRGGRDGGKIDAVLASPGWEVLAAEIVRTHAEGRYPSDHYPVTATIRAPTRR